MAEGEQNTMVEQDAALGNTEKAEKSKDSEKDALKADGEAWMDERPRKPADEMVSYLRSVGGSLESALEEEERAALIRNVFEEIDGHEASLACSRQTTMVMETLLKEASAKQLAKVLSNSREYFGFLCHNRQGSHVVEALFAKIYKVFNGESEQKAAAGTNAEESDSDNSSSDDEDEQADQSKAMTELKKLLGSLCYKLVSSELWWDMMFDPCATHVLRSLVALLSDNNPAELKKNKNKSGSAPVNRKRSKRRRGDPELVASLHAFLVNMSKWEADDMKKAISDTQAGAMVQALLAACSPKHKAWRATVDKALCAPGGGSTCDPAIFKQFAKDRIASHLVQTIVMCADDKVYNEVIFDQCLRGQMKEMCSHPAANFVLQNALSVIRTPEQFCVAMDELEEELSSTLLFNRLGVIWHLCEAAKAADSVAQVRLCRAILAGVKARAKKATRSGPARGTVETLLDLNLPTSGKANSDADADTSDANDDAPAEKTFEKISVSVLGARVVGALLQLPPESVRVIMEGVASIKPIGLKTLCTDPVAGQHVMEVLMNAPATATWAKQRVMTSLKAEIPTIAMNKFGWHFIKKAFDNGGIKEKRIIAKALVKDERRVSGTSFGTKLMKHCKLNIFRKQPDQWESALKHYDGVKRKAALQDMLYDLDKLPTTKRARK